MAMERDPTGDPRDVVAGRQLAVDKLAFPP